MNQTQQARAASHKCCCTRAAFVRAVSGCCHKSRFTEATSRSSVFCRSWCHLAWCHLAGVKADASRLAIQSSCQSRLIKVGNLKSSSPVMCPLLQWFELSAAKWNLSQAEAGPFTDVGECNGHPVRASQCHCWIADVAFQSPVPIQNPLSSHGT